MSANARYSLISQTSRQNEKKASATAAFVKNEGPD
jgi:hypothetical protein